VGSRLSRSKTQGITSSPPRRRVVSFLLDENFSWKLGQALQLLDYPIEYVERVPDLGKGAEDGPIVRWCGANDHVWVTQDDDSRSRGLRMGLLSTEGVAVIFVSPQPKGLQAQTELVIRQYPKWQEKLGVEPRGYSAWLQPPYGALKRLGK
jgi:hypothetical protein